MEEDYSSYDSRGVRRGEKELDGYGTSPHPAANGTLREWCQKERERERERDVRTLLQPTGTAQEKWLSDLALQVQEKQRERENEKMKKQKEKVEEYFPFGKPGCGAPIRSESGRLLVDYQERVS